MGHASFTPVGLMDYADDNNICKKQVACRHLRDYMRYDHSSCIAIQLSHTFKALVILEKDIEEVLPQFQELVLSLSFVFPCYSIPPLTDSQDE